MKKFDNNILTSPIPPPSFINITQSIQSHIPDKAEEKATTEETYHLPQEQIQLIQKMSNIDINDNQISTSEYAVSTQDIKKLEHALHAEKQKCQELTKTLQIYRNKCEELYKKLQICYKQEKILQASVSLCKIKFSYLM